MSLLMNKVVTPVLIWLVGASLGFGASQLLFISPVKEQMRELSTRTGRNEKDIDKIVADIHVRFAKAQDDFTARMSKLVDLVTTDRQTQQDFIAVLRSQNDTLVQQSRQNAELIILLNKGHTP